MKEAAIILLFFASLAVSSFVPNPEDLKNAIPGHLEYDLEFQKKFPHIIPRDGKSRIVGGEEAIPNSRPYQVGMYTPVIMQGDNILYSFCGGSLINARTILTAAHCVDLRNASLGAIILYLGAHNMPPLSSDTNIVQVFSDDVVIHPQWNRSILLNDVAIVRLQISVTLSNRISTILLPRNTSDDFLGTTVLVSGWGRPSDSASNISPVLREVSSFVISNYACRLGFQGLIEESHICCSGAFGRSPCQGDSGGPLILNGVLIGVVSFGSSWGCAHGWPAVYARVTYYLDWIQANSAVVPLDSNSANFLSSSNDQPQVYHVSYY